MLFSLLRGEVIDDTLDKHVSKYFDTSDIADKVREKLLSSNVFLALIAAFIQREIIEAVATGRVDTKREKPLKSQMVNADAKHSMQMSVSLPSRTDSAPSYSPSHRDDGSKTDKHRPEHRLHSWRRHRRHGKGEKSSSMSKRLCKLDDSPSYSESDTHSTHTVAKGRTDQRTTDARCYVL